MSVATLIPSERIENKIYLIRGKKVMLDRDLADLYGVTTGNLNLAVRRNSERFPDKDFMFQLTKEEYGALRLQIATLKRGQHAKYLPYAFTELGVAMLSSVLKSKRAIQINIHILRVFTRLRELLATHVELRQKIEEHDKQIQVIYEAVRKLLTPPREPKKNRIGFRTE
jgi:hypothetical protein